MGTSRTKQRTLRPQACTSPACGDRSAATVLGEVVGEQKQKEVQSTQTPSVHVLQEIQGAWEGRSAASVWRDGQELKLGSRELTLHCTRRSLLMVRMSPLYKWLR